MKKIYISIIDFNSEKDTIKCLQSLEKIKTDDYLVEIIVIDNASKTPFVVPKGLNQTIPVTVIRNDVNKGFSGGHNTGIRYALDHGADYVLILNNDTYVDPDFLVELLAVADKEKKIGIVAPKIYFAKGFEFHKDRYKENEQGKVFWYAGGTMDWNNILGSHRGVDEVDHGQFDKEEKTDFASGCCMLVKREAIEKIGLFDRRYFLYLEDSDFNERMKRAGFAIYYAPKAIIWHKNAGSTGGSGSNLQDYFITRNRLLFGFSYGRLRTKLALVKESLRLLFTGREAQKKGVRDFYLRRFGKGSLGN